jgi:pimeloyl-ACP methyl ester carboxylesterase
MKTVLKYLHGAGAFIAAVLAPFVAMRGHDPVPSLVTGEATLPAGTCNGWTGTALQTRHLGMFADADLEIIPEAGHDVVRDNPDATLAAIRAFLRAQP